uniref:Uncharacterized protein n=1 Tax=Rhizophora mucronata TaxID=61149 RepID=A0A2P2IWK0_RHIMU
MTCRYRYKIKTAPDSNKIHKNPTVSPPATKEALSMILFTEMRATQTS